jgi:hypothetical protein
VRRVSDRFCRTRSLRHAWRPLRARARAFACVRSRAFVRKMDQRYARGVRCARLRQPLLLPARRCAAAPTAADAPRSAGLTRRSNCCRRCAWQAEPLWRGPLRRPAGLLRVRRLQLVLPSCSVRCVARLGRAVALRSAQLTCRAVAWRAVRHVSAMRSMHGAVLRRSALRLGISTGGRVHPVALAHARPPRRTGGTAPFSAAHA